MIRWTGAILGGLIGVAFDLWLGHRFGASTAGVFGAVGALSSYALGSGIELRRMRRAWREGGAAC